jgi:hypothetical protein
MRCTVCNTLLTDFEATRKDKRTGEFLDLCGECATYLPISSIDANDLLTMELERGIIDIRGTEEE